MFYCRSCIYDVVWQVGGMKLVSADGLVDVDVYGGTVRFQSVSKSDEGRYTCTAINDVGSDVGSTQLRVLGM